MVPVEEHFQAAHVSRPNLGHHVFIVERHSVYMMEYYATGKRLPIEDGGQQIARVDLRVQGEPMRPVIYLISCALLFNVSLSAKHWHEDKKHWDKHSNEADHDDRGVNHHADSCYF